MIGTLETGGDVNATGVVCDGAGNCLDTVDTDTTYTAGNGLTLVSDEFSAGTINKENITNVGTLSFDWADSEVVDTITASNYLLLAGGSMTGALTSTSSINSSQGMAITLENKTFCWGVTCNVCEYFNGTHQVTESPCSI